MRLSTMVGYSDRDHGRYRPMAACEWALLPNGVRTMAIG